MTIRQIDIAINSVSIPIKLKGYEAIIEIFLKMAAGILYEKL